MAVEELVQSGGEEGERGKDARETESRSSPKSAPPSLGCKISARQGFIRQVRRRSGTTLSEFVVMLQSHRGPVRASFVPHVE